MTIESTVAVLAALLMLLRDLRRRRVGGDQEVAVGEQIEAIDVGLVLQKAPVGGVCRRGSDQCAEPDAGCKGEKGDASGFHGMSSSLSRQLRRVLRTMPD